MTYRVLILPRAQKEWERLPDKEYQQIRNAVSDLAANPRPAGCVKLRGREGWRIRQGDYRVLYDIDDNQKTVTVLHIRHRREAYRE
jgi:mRNA interferase RelE/StbE